MAIDREHTRNNQIWAGKDYKDRTVSLYVYERDHILEHAIMADNFTAVYDSVEHPDSVYYSGGSDRREVFFKNSSEATYSPKFLTKTVVEYNEANTEGHIVTAFPSIKEGGNIGEQTYPTDQV